MTFVQSQRIYLTVKCYFKDSSGINSKQELAEELREKLEKFMELERHFYSFDVATIRLTYFCGTSHKPRKKPKYIEGMVIKNPKNSIHDIFISHELHIDIDLNDQYNEFFEADKMGSYNIIARKTLDYIHNMTVPAQIRKFGNDRLENDLRKFFVSIGCDV